LETAEHLIGIDSVTINNSINITNSSVAYSTLFAGNTISHSYVGSVNYMSNSTINGAAIGIVGHITDAVINHQYVDGCDSFTGTSSLNIYVPCWTYRTLDCP